ncbi:MAG TPA: AAA family ATPase, partial [Acidimicrobiales bacterium]|nr:AAA family ATPase [Acidimicrobiales bacterium]
MFLKALTLKGFKSFAESTVLEMQPGVTVVVGPNGSGKSNVVDAIGWVLGAQAPSVVRSQRMEDVIFAGTAKRQALGRAEVSLTIDNAEGVLPIELSEVTVTRTLWRSGESDYAINGVPCRLLDVQDLFSDTGVGRQQHVIVGQGQIDAVLNARPEDRRLIIEEAAGVLKHRKRKERSERRLVATEGNLTRLNDLLREVRRQLRPLERQAESTRRHGELVAELHALQVFVAGRELSTLRRRSGEVAAARAEVLGEEKLLAGTLAELDVAVMATESELAHLGGGEVGDALARAQALRERARGLLALVAERRRGVERERSASVDRGVVASLEADAAHLRADIDGLATEVDALEPGARELAAGEADLAAARRAFDAEWGEGVPLPSGRASELRGELGTLRRVLERADGDRARTRARAATVQAKVERLDAEAARAAERLASLPAEADVLAAVRDASAARQAAEDAARAAEQRRDAAEAQRHRWSARADALAQALDAARSRAGAARLADVPGVVGTLLDLVDVDPGWEAAAEAACGEALRAVVVDSVASARRALQVLADGDVSGAVLALGAANPELMAPRVGEPVLAHVRPRRPEVASLLSGVLGTAVAVEGDWVAAVDTALAHPGAVVVTRAGGRFGPDGWHVSTDTTGATGAAGDEARQRAAEAAAAAEGARADHRRAVEVLAAARRTETEASTARDRRQRTLVALSEAVERGRAERADAVAELELLAEQDREAVDRLSRDRQRAAELAAELPRLEAEEAARQARARAMAAARAELDRSARAVADRRGEIDKRRTALADRDGFLRRRLAEVEQRLAGSVEA